MRREDPTGEFVASSEVEGLLVQRRLEHPGPYYKLYPEGTIENFHYALDLSHIVIQKGRDSAGNYDLKDAHARKLAQFVISYMHVDPLR